MLPKKLRISREAFSLLNNGAKTASTPLFFLKNAPIAGHTSRFSFTVSKKVSKKAVVRNKLRRTGFDEIKKIQSDIKPGYLINFSYKREPKNLEEVAQNLKNALMKANLIKNS